MLGLGAIIHEQRKDNPLNDPRVNKIVEDGRFYLQASAKKYDIITSEPPPPKAASIVNLYTQEYFKLISTRLKENGMATYWLPVYQFTEIEAKSVITAFCAAFEDCSLWNGGGFEWMLVGSRNYKEYNTRKSFSKLWRNKKLRKNLIEIGYEKPEQMLASFIADSEQLKSITAGSLALRDNYPKRLSSKSQSRKEKKHHMKFFSSIVNPTNILKRFTRSSYIKRSFSPELAQSARDYFRYEQHISKYLAFLPPKRLNLFDRIDDAFEILTQTDLETLPLWVLGSDPKEVEIASGLTEKNEFLAILTHLRGIIQLKERNYKSALKEFDRVLEIDPGSIDAIPYAVLSHVLLEEFSEAQNLIEMRKKQLQAISEFDHLANFISKKYMRTTASGDTSEQVALASPL